jgi:hypothetical protein
MNWTGTIDGTLVDGPAGQLPDVDRLPKGALYLLVAAGILGAGMLGYATCLAWKKKPE